MNDTYTSFLGIHMTRVVRTFPRCAYTVFLCVRHPLLLTRALHFECVAYLEGPCTVRSRTCLPEMMYYFRQAGMKPLAIRSVPATDILTQRRRRCLRWVILANMYPSWMHRRRSSTRESPCLQHR